MKNFGLIMEHWIGFKKVLNERNQPPEFYGSSYEELRSKLDMMADKTFIFFDTETTGLGDKKMYNQITQLAAIKVKMDFSSDKDIEIVDKFDKRIVLLPDATSRARWEEKNYAKWESEEPTRRETFEREEAQKAEQDPTYEPKQYTPEKYPFFTISKALNMTGYASPDEIEAMYNKDVSEEEKITVVSVSGEEKSHNPSAGNEVYFIPTEVLKEFAEFCSPTEEIVMVAQNAPFDVSYVNTAFRRIGVEAPDDMVIDTVQIFQKYLVPVMKSIKDKMDQEGTATPEETHMIDSLMKTNYKGQKQFTVSLGFITKAFGVKDEGWHNALADVIMLAKVMKKIVNFLDNREETKGIEVKPSSSNYTPEEQELINQFENMDEPYKWSPNYQEWYDLKEKVYAIKNKGKTKRPPAGSKPSDGPVVTENKVFRIKIRR